MPKKTRVFPGLTRQVVVSDDTHQLLAHAAQRENKYMSELADEIIRHALEDRYKQTQDMNGAKGQGRQSPHVRLYPKLNRALR
jgi:hypothetical protein